MATILTIKSSVTGLEQKVSPEAHDLLKQNGWKGSIIKTEDTSKTAKEPTEVTESKKK